MVVKFELNERGANRKTYQSFRWCHPPHPIDQFSQWFAVVRPMLPMHDVFAIVWVVRPLDRLCHRKSWVAARPNANNDEHRANPVAHHLPTGSLWSHSNWSTNDDDCCGPMRTMVFPINQSYCSTDTIHCHCHSHTSTNNCVIVIVSTTSDHHHCSHHRHHAPFPIQLTVALCCCYSPRPYLSLQRTVLSYYCCYCCYYYLSQSFFLGFFLSDRRRIQLLPLYLHLNRFSSVQLTHWFPAKPNILISIHSDDGWNAEYAKYVDEAIQFATWTNTQKVIKPWKRNHSINLHTTKQTELHSKLDFKVHKNIRRRRHNPIFPKFNKRLLLLFVFCFFLRE